MTTLDVYNDRECIINQQYLSMKMITNGLYKHYLLMKNKASLTVQDRSNIKQCTEYIFQNNFFSLNYFSFF